MIGFKGSSLLSNGRRGDGERGTSEGDCIGGGDPFSEGDQLGGEMIGFKGSSLLPNGRRGDGDLLS